MSYLKFVPKRWGYEKHICNYNGEPNYCGKILFIAAGQSFSYHFHKNKHENFHILKGCGELFLIDDVRQNNFRTYEEWSHSGYRDDDLDYGDYRQYLNENETVEIKPYAGHKIWAQSDLTIVEFSTYDCPSDSYRLEQIKEGYIT